MKKFDQKNLKFSSNLYLKKNKESIDTSLNTKTRFIESIFSPDNNSFYTNFKNIGIIQTLKGKNSLSLTKSITKYSSNKKKSFEKSAEQINNIFCINLQNNYNNISNGNNNKGNINFNNESVFSNKKIEEKEYNNKKTFQNDIMKKIFTKESGDIIDFLKKNNNNLKNDVNNEINNLEGNNGLKNLNNINQMDSKISNGDEDFNNFQIISKKFKKDLKIPIEEIKDISGKKIDVNIFEETNNQSSRNNLKGNENLTKRNSNNSIFQTVKSNTLGELNYQDKITNENLEMNKSPHNFKLFKKTSNSYNSTFKSYNNFNKTQKNNKYNEVGEICNSHHTNSIESIFPNQGNFMNSQKNKTGVNFYEEKSSIPIGYMRDSKEKFSIRSHQENKSDSNKKINSNKPNQINNSNFISNFNGTLSNFSNIANLCNKIGNTNKSEKQSDSFYLTQNPQFFSNKLTNNEKAKKLRAESENKITNNFFKNNTSLNINNTSNNNTDPRKANLIKKILSQKNNIHYCPNCDHCNVISDENLEKHFNLKEAKNIIRKSLDYIVNNYNTDQTFMDFIISNNDKEVNTKESLKKISINKNSSHHPLEQNNLNNNLKINKNEYENIKNLNKTAKFDIENLLNTYPKNTNNRGILQVVLHFLDALVNDKTSLEGIAGSETFQKLKDILIMQGITFEAKDGEINFDQELEKMFDGETKEKLKKLFRSKVYFINFLNN